MSCSIEGAGGILAIDAVAAADAVDACLRCRWRDCMRRARGWIGNFCNGGGSRGGMLYGIVNE